MVIGGMNLYYLLLMRCFSKQQIFLRCRQGECHYDVERYGEASEYPLQVSVGGAALRTSSAGVIVSGAGLHLRAYRVSFLETISLFSDFPSWSHPRSRVGPECLDFSYSPLI